MTVSAADAKTLRKLSDFYRTHLLKDIVPFWVEHGIDEEYGGVFTGVADDGKLMSSNKYIWSNARALYTFSAIYNDIDQDPRWLAIARKIYDFCAANGREESGVWRFLVDRQGRRVEGEKAIQVDAFAIMGLTEFARANGDDRALDIAFQTYESTRRRLAQPGNYGTHPYPIPEGMKAHRDHFQFAYAYFGLWQLNGDSEVLYETIRHAGEVMDNFRRPERKALLEYVSIDNLPLDTPAGRTMVPGHAIESMWFLLHIFKRFNDSSRIREATDVIRWAIERGWDSQYGGILLGLDIDGTSPPYWKHWDMKLWWVACEALYALLLSYSLTGESWFLDWHHKVHEWTFRYFPNRKHGEWFQRLNRDGSVSDTVVALPVKDPFHLPRALIMCIKLLDEISQRYDTDEASSQ